MSLRDEIKARAKQFVDENFGGDYHAAFDHFDTDADGRISKGELESILREFGVGNFLTRSLYAREGLKTLDLNRDGGISWDEFQVALVSL